MYSQKCHKCYMTLEISWHKDTRTYRLRNKRSRDIWLWSNVGMSWAVSEHFHDAFHWYVKHCNAWSIARQNSLWGSSFHNFIKMANNKLRTGPFGHGRTCCQWIIPTKDKRKDDREEIVQCFWGCFKSIQIWYVHQQLGDLWIYPTKEITFNWSHFHSLSHQVVIIQ